MRPAWMDLQPDSDRLRIRELDLAAFLAIVRERDPLTFPEILDALPPEFDTSGSWRLIVAAHPRVVLWDGLGERSAMLLGRLFETGQLALQPCAPALYQFAERRLDLPPVPAIPVFPRHDYWLTCTIGIGPVASFNEQWKIGYCDAGASN